jgi:redox-sensitive bicupin YhaK (pirin superfamily)
MITLRRSAERGHFDHGWLDTRHTFSFAGYQDAAHMGFRDLRVINEDVVQPDRGFGTHPHRDMEIVTYVLEGALEHRDSMGNTGVIGAGEVQRMTAGTGITHSEYNHSGTEPVHLMQIWIIPAETGLTPSYEQRTLLDPGAGDGSAATRLQLVASPDAGDGSLLIHQDVRLYAVTLDAGSRTQISLRPGRRAWLQVTRGELTLNGLRLTQGDGAALSDEATLDLQALDAGEALLFDLN